MNNLWQKLPKPFFTLAPMANVTDAAFRKIIAKYGKPDVMWTEFVSADGLVSAGRDKLLMDLKYSEEERPIVAQLFTGHPEKMLKAARLVRKLKFDGLDINMGCPDRKVEKQGGGAAMIRNPEMAVGIIEAARKGFGDSAAQPFYRRQMSQRSPCSATLRHLSAQRVARLSYFPVTVKTRLGYNKIELDWIRILLEQELPALTIHLRTRKEMSDAPAHWEIMPEIIKMRDEVSPETLIIGNGDVETVEEGLSKLNKCGGDGVMIGRGIFGKPWLFDLAPQERGICFFTAQKKFSGAGFAILFLSSEKANPSFLGGGDYIKWRLNIMLEHAKLFDKMYISKKIKPLKNFAVMKKHFKAYVSGWDGAKELRVKLMKAKNYEEVAQIVKKACG